MKNKLEPLITLDTAKLAKERGLKTSNSGYFFDEKGNKVMDTILDKNLWGGKYPAPRQSFLEDWLFLEHSINIELTYDDATWFVYVGEFTIPDSSVILVGSIECEGFEDAKRQKYNAKEIALQEALKLI